MAHLRKAAQLYARQFQEDDAAGFPTFWGQDAGAVFMDVHADRGCGAVRFLNLGVESHPLPRIGPPLTLCPRLLHTKLRFEPGQRGPK